MKAAALRLTFCLLTQLLWSAVTLAAPATVRVAVDDTYPMHYFVWGLAAATVILLALLASNWWLRKVVDRRTAQLRQNEEQYRELVQSANSIILRWKRDGTITFINDYGLRFFGFQAEELLGRSVFDTIMPELKADGTPLYQTMNAIFTDPETHLHNTNQNITKRADWSGSPGQITLFAMKTALYLKCSVSARTSPN